MDKLESNAQAGSKEIFDGVEQWQLLASDVWDPRPTYRALDDSSTREVSVVKGNAVLFRDGRTYWTNQDNRWTRLGSRGGDYFEGTIAVDADGSMRITNNDSGVTTVHKKDGSTTRSITTRDGATESVTTDSTGAIVSHKSGSVEWSTKDGSNWSNHAGHTWKGSIDIDADGEFLAIPEGGPKEDRIVQRSAQLAERIEKEGQLEKKYGVRFYQPGEEFEDKDEKFQCHHPSMGELKAVESVLDRNQQMRLDNIKIAFAKPGPATDNGRLFGLYQKRGATGNILIMPAHKDTKGWDNLEGTLEHEIMHHEQSENWGNWPWGSERGAKGSEALNDSLGWRYDQAKWGSILLDQNDKEWVRLEGSWLGVNGMSVEPGRSKTNDEMRKIAKVRPATSYFTNPVEMQAEALSMFRLNRQGLLRESPQLYEIAKKQDQDLIDKKFGKDAEGKPRFIRNMKGNIVENTPENSGALTEAEERIRKNQFQPFKLGNILIVDSQEAEERDRFHECDGCVHQHSDSRHA